VEDPGKRYRRRETEHQIAPTEQPNRSTADKIKYDTKKETAGKLGRYRNENRQAASNLELVINNEDLFNQAEFYNSKYVNNEHGQEVQGFIRSQTQVKERIVSRE